MRQCAFTTANWDTAQTVTVTAAHDDNAVSELRTLTHTASGGGYAGVSNDLPVTVTDDDTSGIVFDPASVTVTEEDATGESYTVKLATQPAGDVTVTITGHGGTPLSLSGSGLSGDALTFTTANWDTAQTVTVTAAHDDNAVNEDITLTHTASGSGYAGVSNDLPVTVTDDDTSGIVFDPASVTVTEEDATGESYTVKLATQPAGDVTVTITGHGGTPLSLSGSGLSGDALTFTTANWDTAQTVTVTAAHDDNAVNEDITLTHTASGSGYAGVSNDLPVTVTDDDPQVTVSFGHASYSVDEGATIDVTVTLSADPERTVVIPITTSNQGGASSSDYSGVPATVTFNSGDTSQTITFSATQDTFDDDDESVLLGFRTMPETGVTVGSPNQATINIEDVPASTLDCSTAIWCADLGFSDLSMVDWGWQKLEHGKSESIDPPSSLSDETFTYGGADYFVGSIVLEAGTYPPLDNSWSRHQQAKSRLRVSIHGADDGSNVPLTHYEDWVLNIDGLELPFVEAFKAWDGGFLWVTPRLQEFYNDWVPSSEVKIGIREVNPSQDPTTGLPWAPMSVRAYGQDGTLNLRWWRPHWQQHEPKVTGYILQWKPATVSWSASSSVSERRLGRGEKIVLAKVTGLPENTLYTVRVASFNDTGVGPWSDDALARTQTGGSRVQQHASVNGSEVTLHFGFPLDETLKPAPTSFIVIVDQAVAKVDSVQVVGNNVVLTLEEAVHSHHYVMALYEEPNDPAADALHDTDGNRVDTIRYYIPDAVNNTPKSHEPLLTGSLTNVPSSHDGATPIVFNVAFREKVWISLGLAKHDLLEVEGGGVTSAHPVNRSTELWKVTVQPETRGSIVVTLSGGFCTSAFDPNTESENVPGAPCAPGDRMLTNRPTETIRGPESSEQLVQNSPPEGRPRINGTPAVGQTLSADTSGISDVDGLDNAVLVFRWLADDEAIEGTAGSSYILADGDLGKAIRVRVDFTDDAGNPESLTSEPTSPVAEAADLELQSATVDGSTLTLTYNKTLDTAVSILPSAFAVDVNGNSRLVMAVGVGQSNVLLFLSTPVEAGDVVTVDYTAPTEDGAARVQDTAGNAAASFSGQDVTNSTAERANNPATGTPTISGTAQVGQTLTADTSGISDADGLDNAVFAYQWLADDVAIPDADAEAYTLTSTERGKAIKVTVSFTDDAGNQESLTESASISATATEPYTEYDSDSELPARKAYVDVTVEWEPADDHGNAVISYEYRMAEGESIPSSEPWLPAPNDYHSDDELALTVRRLKPDTRYAFELRTVSSEGASANTVQAMVSTPRFSGPHYTMSAPVSASEGQGVTITVRRTNTKDGESTALVEIRDTYDYGIAIVAVEFGSSATRATTTYTIPDDG